MDRQKIITTILIVVEAGLLGIVLIFSALNSTASNVKDYMDDKRNEQAVNNTEDVQSTEGTEEDTTESQAQGDWFASETRETFSEEVEQKLTSMTTEEKVAQLFIISPETLTGVDRVTISGNGTRDALRQYPVGGLIYAQQNFLGTEQGEALISGAQGYSQDGIELPLFIVVKDDATDYTHFATVQIETQDRGALLTELGEAPALLNGITICTYRTSAEIVAAIKGGMDMIYEPADFVKTYEAVLEAVNDGTISQVRLENAVGRVLSEKME